MEPPSAYFHRAYQPRQKSDEGSIGFGTKKNETSCTGASRHSTMRNLLSQDAGTDFVWANCGNSLPREIKGTPSTVIETQFKIAEVLAASGGCLQVCLRSRISTVDMNRTQQAMNRLILQSTLPDNSARSHPRQTSFVPKRNFPNPQECLVIKAHLKLARPVPASIRLVHQILVRSKSEIR